MSFFDRVLASERRQIDDALRSEMPERFVHLSDGHTHFERKGPADGKPIILIHGFSVPNFIWDPTFEALTNEGFQVIRYDLFGRGLSDRPHAPYTLALFTRQLQDLLAALELKAPVAILSLSMGGVIAANFAVRNPNQIAQLSFIAPAGFALNLPWQAKLLHWPPFGEVLLGLFSQFGSAHLLEAMLSDFYQPTQAAKDYFIPRYSQQMQFQGFKRALLSTLRNGMLDENLSLFEKLGQFENPVQVIWGREDGTVPFRHHKTFQQLVPRTEFHAIPEAGHIPHFERSELVNPLLIDFFSR